MKPKAKLLFLLIILTFSITLQGTAQNNSNQDEVQNLPAVIEISTENLPELVVLNSKDAVFKEFSKIVEDNYKAIARKQAPEMIFFKHTFTTDDEKLIGKDLKLISLASRLNISYDTIATLNGIDNASEKLLGKTLIIPSAPGLFIKRYGESTKNSLEILLHESHSSTQIRNIDFYFNINGEDFIFLTNQKMSSTERAYFLDSVLGLPLEKGTFWVSSEFGKRKNPVSGEWKDHNGVDLAAPEGTPVHAVKDGHAAYCIKNDPTFGNYIILSHDTGKMTSVYAHLSTICINQYDFVRKGDIIGYVGHTGMATGDHLHFEIRQGGVAKDPQTQIETLR